MADKDKDEKQAKKGSNVRKIKYMGAADERNFSKTDNFGGRLPDGLGVDLVFNEGNNHIAEVELDEDAMELFMSQQERDGSGAFIPAFLDVTGMRRPPDNVWQERWRPQGLADARNVGAVLADQAAPGAGVGSGGSTGEAVGGSTGGGIT